MKKSSRRTAAAPSPSWKRCLVGPVFEPLRDFTARLTADGFPGCTEMNVLVGDVHRNAAGQPIRFSPPTSSGGDGYESHIFRTGEVPTRANNWHDFFNALTWLAFPRTKRELNRLHHEHAAGESGRRGRARDALTLFDESGLLIACSEASLAHLLREFRWRQLFVERREAVRRCMRFFVFGHALQEQMLHPYPGVTGKGLILDCGAEFMECSPQRQLSWLDERAASLVASGAVALPQSLAPLPLLGIPGWDPASEDPAYYDNARVFRPGRTKRRMNV